MNSVVGLVAIDSSAHQDLPLFLSALYQAEAIKDVSFKLITYRGSLADQVTRPSHVEALYLTEPTGSERSRVKRLFDDLNRLHQSHHYSILHVNTALEQLASTRLKSRKYRPLIVLRNHFHIGPVAPTRKNQKIYNELTNINCYFRRSDMFFARDANKMGFMVDNPYLLQQEELGEQSVSLMLEHCYLSLLRPSRNHPVSGDRVSKEHIKIAFVTHFYCNQRSVDSVMDMLNRYAAMSPEVLDRIHFVIVDDGSPVQYEIPHLPLNITWLRIDQDIRWNQGGARNLGAIYAKADNIILTDLDHEFPEETFRRLIRRRPCGKHLYKFWRKDPAGHWSKGHPNIFLTSRARFLELFGYDEEFAGNYGGEDFRFVKFQKVQGTLHYHLSKRYYCTERSDIDRNKSYHSLQRDLSFNTPVDTRKRFEIENYGHAAGHSRTNLNFTWSILADQWRPLNEQRKPDRIWKRIQFLRQIMPRLW